MTGFPSSRKSTIPFRDTWYGKGVMMAYRIEIAPVAPADAQVTDYDRDHLLIYAVLLGERDRGIRWQVVARNFLFCDPEGDPEGARMCWESHIARGEWIATDGYAQMVAAYRDAVLADQIQSGTACPITASSDIGPK